MVKRMQADETVNHETRPLDYQVPQLGKVSAKLYEYSAQTYNLLDYYGHIKKLRTIDQLGVIRNVYEGAHHSRWEYVMLQLSLIHRLSVETDEKDRKVARGLGLGSSNIEFQGRCPTGADILQMWTLLLNAGHLPGTFATERALLKSCKKHRDLQRTIRQGLPGETRVRQYFTEILREDDIYSFHKILICFYLERYRKYILNQSRFVDFLQEIMSFYLFPSDDHRESQENYCRLFRRIRQISYLFLDFQYGPIPVDFDLGAIFFNLQDYVHDLFRQQSSPMIGALNDFETLLSRNMYHGADSIRELAGHAEKIEKAVDKDIQNHQLTKITGLYRYLQGKTKPKGKKAQPNFEPTRTEWKNSLNIHILLEPLPIFLREFKKYLTYDIENKCMKKYSRRCCLLTYQGAPAFRQVAITLSFRPDSKPQRNMPAIAEFLKDLVHLNKNIRGEELVNARGFNDYIDHVFQEPYQDLLVTVLAYVTKPHLYFELKSEHKILLPLLSAIGSKRAVAAISKLCVNVDSEHERFHELKTLQLALHCLNHHSALLVPLLRILVYNEEMEHLTDIDGFALGVKGKDLGVLLVEAKEQKQGSAADSKKHLQDTLGKLDFRTSKKPQIIELDKGAYCYLQIDGN